ncbi:YkgJ family cysteine cluster protein [Sunxiuqinia elliptica]|nr:YkgJ family cysteine cluster protein [Sunxiuqinia elliptica]
MKPNKARNLLKPLYYKVDRDMETISNVCEKGCFYCCYQPIELLKIEKVILADFIKTKLENETKDIVKENVIKWLDYFDENTSNDEPLSDQEAFYDFRYRAENIPFPCPLLINGECSVYKARPLTCRVHFVNDSKKLCEKDKLRDGAPTSFNYRMRVVEELKTNMELEITPLAYALAEILNINRTMKKIRKSTL